MRALRLRIDKILRAQLKHTQAESQLRTTLFCPFFFCFFVFCLCVCVRSINNDKCHKRECICGASMPPPLISGYRVSKESAHLISQNVFRGSLLAV